MLFVILFTSIFFSQEISAENCQRIYYSSQGELPNQQALSTGQIVAWSYPLIMEKGNGQRRTQERLGNLKPLKAVVEARFSDTPPPTTLSPSTIPPTVNATQPPTGGVEFPEGEVGKWQGYCTGLGAADPDSAQICHHIYTMNIGGFFAGTNVYSGGEALMIAITGGAGGLVDGSGGVNVTYVTSQGTFYHDVNLCFD